MHTALKLSKATTTKITAREMARREPAKQLTDYGIFLADTEESKKIHFNLRYQVYCIEKGYEDASQHDGMLEMDGYDSDADHFLIKCKETEQWIGTFRLITDRFETLPLHEKSSIFPHCHFDDGKIVTELSRLAIIQPYRRGTLSRLKASLAADHQILRQVFFAALEHSIAQGHRRHSLLVPKVTG
ncbi:MAG: GNAT family N-acyltransferase [Candidatus Methylumidiphilus sp.]